jgi:hypothetical protein
MRVATRNNNNNHFDIPSLRYAVNGTQHATATTTITSTSLHCTVGTVHGTMVTNQGKGINARHHKDENCNCNRQQPSSVLTSQF